MQCGFLCRWGVSPVCDPTMLNLWSLVRGSPEQATHVGLPQHLLAMLPHLQQCSHLVSGLALVKGSTQYHTPTTLIPFLTRLRARFLPFIKKTTHDAEISPFWLPCGMPRGLLATIPGPGLLLLRAQREFHPASRAGPLCHLPCTSRVVQTGS